MDLINLNDLPVVDWGQGNQLAENADELTKELLVMFLLHLPETQAGINQAYNEKDAKSLDNQLHKLQGACVYCGLLRLKAAVVNLSKTLKSDSNNFPDKALLDQVNQEMDAIVIELKDKGIST